MAEPGADRGSGGKGIEALRGASGQTATGSGVWANMPGV